MPDNSNCGEEDRKCPQKFQSHLKICDFPWTAGVCVYGFPSLPQPHVPQQTCQNDFQARVAKNFQSHLNICDYLEEVWQPTVTLYWNIWNSRKIILMSPKKEKLYYSKLWRKKRRGEKYPFLTTSVYLSQALKEVALHFKTFLPFSSTTTNSQRIIHMEQKKVSEWPTL